MADPTTAVVTVYDPSGNPVNVTLANARDLIRFNGYSHKAPAKAKATPAAEPADPAVQSALAVEEPEDPALVAEPAEGVPMSDPLPDELSAEFLQNFSVSSLREIAADRFELKVRANASKAALIDQIMDAYLSSLPEE